MAQRRGYDHEENMYACLTGAFLVVICITSHFYGWKAICQSNSQRSKLLRSSLSFSSGLAPVFSQEEEAG